MRYSVILSILFCGFYTLNAQPSLKAKTFKKVIEIRSYNLKENKRDDFHRLVLEVLPMLKRYNMEVVSYGPSLHDKNSYFLIRSFESLDDRTKKHDSFYGSDEWMKGPRESVLALIDSYTTVVIFADEEMIEKLKYFPLTD